MKKNQVGENHLCLRLGNQFDDFLKAGQFTDCVLITETDDRFPCHRLILSQVSEWFKKYFIENPIKKFGDKCEVNIKVNPMNILKVFIDLIYTNHAEINIKNLPLLLKMCVYYECPKLIKALQHFYLDATNDETVLYLAQKFIELDLIDDAKSLAPNIAQHLKRIHNNENDLRYTIEDLFKSLSPSVFAAVINQDLLKNVEGNERRFTDEDKVRYIDNFVLFHGNEITDEKEKEALASPIDWNSPVAFQYLTRHQCDWLPSRIARPLINRILNNRRLIQSALKKSMRKAADNVSRWYVYSWAQSCRNAITVRGEPLVDVVEFIRTLGGITNPLDPVKYGFFRTFCTPKPLTEDFGPSNVVIDNDQLYFMAQKENEIFPGVGIDLGQGVRFKPHSLSLNTHVLPRPYTSTRPVNQKPYIKKFCFKIGADQNECINSRPLNGSEVPPENEGIVKGLSLNNDDKKCNAMMFQLNGPQTNGGYMMRVVSIEVNGSFECS